MIFLFYGIPTDMSHEPLTQATGPLTQATGLLRSDAGVGIGMLRGIFLFSANWYWMIPLGIPLLSAS